MALRAPLSKVYHYLRAVPKSILFNFYYLPFKQAVKFPIVVSHRVKIQKMSGSLRIPITAKMGKIRFGFGQVQVADYTQSRMIWSVSKTAQITLGERVKIGTGCKLHIDGDFKVGARTNFTGEATIVCKKKIEVGSECLISWQTLLMDSDFHPIFDHAKHRVNPDKAICIGDNVWIGAKTSMLKGACIGNNTIVATASHLTKSFPEGDVILGGNPAKVIGSMKGKHYTD